MACRIGTRAGRSRCKFIDFENSANNDFLVINQFKVELTSGRGHVIPDAVLFVNGIPLVVAEFKSPGIQNPLQEAINQLLRYSNQRRELFPTLYTDNEGVERLFHTNQLLIASNFLRGARGDHRRSAGGVSGMGRHQSRADEHGRGGVGC